MIYQGISGTIYEIGERLAGGGEGSIYAIEKNDLQVAKIFKSERRNAQREEKLRLMVLKKLEEKQLQQITWPQDVIYDGNGFAGYVMPKLKEASSLTELYSAEKYDLRFRLLAAINLCAAVDTVHEMGQVCGDLNPQNICINLDKEDKDGFKVTLVDTDSYHFIANGKTYRCEVGLGEFIAPELQNKMDGLDLKSVSLPSYTKQTDLFALAVHIFYLLMNGCHPFACAGDSSPKDSNIVQMTAGTKENSVVTPQPVENIKSGFFPFCGRREGIVIPIYAPEFESLPYRIQKMFIRTFADGYREPSKRVSASEWKQALSDLSRNIKKCSSVENHYYFDHVNECPLCKVNRKIESILGKQPEIPQRQEEQEQSLSMSGSMSMNLPYSYQNTGANNYAGYAKQKKRKRVDWGRLIYLGILGIFIMLPIIIPCILKFDGFIMDTEDVIQKLIKDASTAVADKDYDSAILYCNEAILLDSGGIESRKRAYYWKGKALYAKGDLEIALEVLKEGLDKEGYGGKIDDKYDKLIEKIQNDTIQSQYEQLIEDASTAIADKDYDSAISDCDEAILLDNDGIESKKQAYYWKGKALYAKGDLENALEVLEEGDYEECDVEIDFEYDELIEKIQNAIQEKRKKKAKAKADAKRLNKLSKIISSIMDRQYKKAGTLADRYCANHTFKKIYVQKGKIVDSIKSGKGFMIKEDDYLAYYGDFKNGKRHGKGIEVGVVYGDNYKIWGQYKNNKLNGRAQIYQWNQKLGKNTCNMQIVGSYKNNKENGKMKITYYHKNGSVFHIYYGNSVNGKRSVIQYDDEIGYVFAKTKDGSNWIGNTEKKWLSGHGHPWYCEP